MFQLTIDDRAFKESLPAVFDQVGDEMDQITATVAARVAARAASLAPVGYEDDRDVHLKDSLGVKRVRRLVYEVTSKSGHSSFVEFGTHRSRARPFMRPAAFSEAGK